MGLLDLFRRPSPVSSLTDVDDFVDRHAAFLVQKCIFEYARARSGIFSSMLLKEAAFVAAINESRWRNYPICLGHVAQMVDAALRPYAGEQTVALTDGLVASITRVTGRYAVPDGMPADFWALSRDAIEQRLRRASLAAPRPVKDIAKEDFQRFFDQLPIHESLRGHDFVLVQNNLRVNLCRAYETFIERADCAAVAELLITGPAAVDLPRVGRRAG